MKNCLQIILVIFVLCSCSDRKGDSNFENLNNYLVLALEEDYAEFEESIYSSGYSMLGRDQLKLFTSIHARLDSIRGNAMDGDRITKREEDIEFIRSLLKNHGLDSENKLVALLSEAQDDNEFHINSRLFEIRLLDELKEGYLKGLVCFDAVEPKFEGEIVLENGKKFFKGKASLKAFQAGTFTEYSTINGEDTLRFESNSDGYAVLKIPVKEPNQTVDINASVITYFGERIIPAEINR